MSLSLVITHLFWPYGWLLPYCFRGVGDVRFAAGVSTACTWIYRVGLTYCLVRFTTLGILSVPVVVLADNITRAVAMHAYYYVSSVSQS